MLKFAIFFALALVASAQHGYHNNPQTAAIISEQRYLSGDGKFGAAYTQEDGIDFKEETDADGNRHGSYSYIDPTGQKRTISYTAGKDGFRASGDHLPVAPAAPPQHAPQPHYQPQPQYQPQPYTQPQQYHSARSDDYDDGSYDPRYNDPSFGQSGNFHQAPQAPVHHHHHAPAAVPTHPPLPTHPPSVQQQIQHAHQFHQSLPQHHQQPSNYHTTPPPHRFQPPGKLSLNRTPDGYSYSFNKPNHAA
ncbi:activating signal cointegrator 1 complex subunit 2 homolog isoform X1 [Lutzomyia longipalpis]|uniref:activating signal cointegrator 1 complex subunit 2 homolog isoform X1 n=1 Tax=Lutzomyia longipalpis TaxID=7200 RepID=UPI00248405C2|nr:activating signal cointegrator 1 complex subunit 2 homolog isoform X1 [Lutzomyia longipalpis]